MIETKNPVLEMSDMSEDDVAVDLTPRPTAARKTQNQLRPEMSQGQSRGLRSPPATTKSKSKLSVPTPTSRRRQTTKPAVEVVVKKKSVEQTDEGEEEVEDHETCLYPLRYARMIIGC